MRAEFAHAILALLLSANGSAALAANGSHALSPESDDAATPQPIPPAREIELARAPDQAEERRQKIEDIKKNPEPKFADVAPLLEEMRKERLEANPGKDSLPGEEEVALTEILRHRELEVAKASLGKASDAELARAVDWLKQKLAFNPESADLKAKLERIEGMRSVPKAYNAPGSDRPMLNKDGIAVGYRAKVDDQGRLVPDRTKPIGRDTEVSGYTFWHTTGGSGKDGDYQLWHNAQPMTGATAMTTESSAHWVRMVSGPVDVSELTGVAGDRRHYDAAAGGRLTEFDPQARVNGLRNRENQFGPLTEGVSLPSHALARSALAPLVVTPEQRPESAAAPAAAPGAAVAPAASKEEPREIASAPGAAGDANGRSFRYDNGRMVPIVSAERQGVPDVLEVERTMYGSRIRIPGDTLMEERRDENSTGAFYVYSSFRDPSIRYYLKRDGDAYWLTRRDLRGDVVPPAVSRVTLRPFGGNSR